MKRYIVECLYADAEQILDEKLRSALYENPIDGAVEAASADEAIEAVKDYIVQGMTANGAEYHRNENVLVFQDADGKPEHSFYSFRARELADE